MLGNENLKRWVFSCRRNDESDGADMTRLGRLFQVRGAAEEKALSPTVDKRVGSTISEFVHDDLSMRLEGMSAIRRLSSER